MCGRHQRAAGPVLVPAAPDPSTRRMNMSYIVSEGYEAFIAASDLRRVPVGVRFIAVGTVVLLAFGVE